MQCGYDRAKIEGLFTEGPFVVYAKLNSMTWSGKLIMYANIMRRMAGFNGRGPERIVKMAFVNGFPNHISIAAWCTHYGDE